MPDKRFSGTLRCGTSDTSDAQQEVDHDYVHQHHARTGGEPIRVTEVRIRLSASPISEKLVLVQRISRATYLTVTKVRWKRAQDVCPGEANMGSVHIGGVI